MSADESEKAKAKAEGKAGARRPEDLSAADVAKDPASGTFWANYVQTRAASKVEAAEASEKAGPAGGETEVDFHARIRRMMLGAQADFELSDKIAAMVAMPAPSNDDAKTPQAAPKPSPLHLVPRTRIEKAKAEAEGKVDGLCPRKET